MKHYIILLLLVFYSSARIHNIERVRKFIERVFGGEKLHQADIYKFLVKIDIYYEETVFCTGSIIGERWIITAAHCFSKTESDTDIIATQAVEDLSIIIDYMKPQNVKRHPNFHPLSEPAQYDLALLQTTKTIIFDEYVQPIHLSVTPLRFGEVIKLAGYGESDIGHNIPVDGYTIATRCTGYEQLVYTNMFCSYDIVGAGFGDSGGPLIVDGKLVGVVSEGYCTAANHWSKCVTAYASIPGNLNWIVDTVANYTYLNTI